MTDPNPYQSPADADRQPINRDRARVTILAIVLLNVAFSASKIVRNLPDELGGPESTAVMIGAVLVLWTAWMAADLFAVRLIWRGRAAGRWILVASFGLRGIAQVGVAASWLPLLVRSPSLVLTWPWPSHAIHAVCYCGVTLWLLHPRLRFLR
jgi:hypothetical protein